MLSRSNEEDEDEDEDRKLLKALAVFTFDVLSPRALLLPLRLLRLLLLSFLNFFEFFVEVLEKRKRHGILERPRNARFWSRWAISVPISILLLLILIRQTTNDDDAK